MMSNWAIRFLIIAIIAAILGFTSIAGAAVEIARIMFFVFFITAVVIFIFGRTRKTETSQ